MGSKVSSLASMLLLWQVAVGVAAQDSAPSTDAEEKAARNEAAVRAEAKARFGKPPDDAVGFGEARQWALSSDAALVLQRATTRDVEDATTSVVLMPAADYFVIRNLSLGGMVGLTYSKTGGNTSARFAIGPRIGYNLGVSRLVSLWPKVGFSFAHTRSAFDRESGGSEEKRAVQANALALNLLLPLIVHPAAHFFVGFGPFLDSDLTGDSASTVWGVKLTLGGWL